MRRVLEEYKEEMFGCSHRPQSTSFLMHCDSIPQSEIEIRYQQDPYVSYVVKAVSALTAAFRLVQLDHCADNVKAACLRKVHEDLHDDIQSNLRKLSFSSMVESNQEMQGTQHHFTRNGRLVANKQHVFVINRQVGLEQVGWYSEDEGLHLQVPLESHIMTTEIPIPSPLVNEYDRSSFGRSVRNNAFVSNEKESQIVNKETKLDTLPVFSYESFISRTWALVVVSVAIVGFFISLWMLLYVFQKISDGTLNGSQIMGVLLLIGVMGLFASVIPWVLPPNEIVCAVRHFMHPLLMVLCFSILLVKSMQLRSLVTIGLGGSIPQINQIVSLFFMLMVQTVIAVEWYLASRPIGIKITDGYPECGVSNARFLLLHIYPTVLLLLSFFYGVSVLKVRRNFNEGRWITCATTYIIPIFAAWPVVYYFAPIPFHDPSVSVSVLAVAGILLAAIFLPKMHTISQQNHLKMSPTDLSRSHSDATVYTGFSDYVPFVGLRAPPPPPPPPPQHHPQCFKPSKQKPLYPIYGYTTNQFINPSESRPKKKKSSLKKEERFNGMNYVCPPVGPHVKSFAEWSKEYDPSYSRHKDFDPSHVRHNKQNHHHPNRRLPSKPTSDTDEPVTMAQVVYSVTRSAKGSAHPHRVVLPEQELSESNDRQRIRQSSSSDESTVIQALNDEMESETMQQQTSSSSLSRRRTRSNASNSNHSQYEPRHHKYRQSHSQSPTDGMILTASGLTLTQSSQMEDDQESNNETAYRVSEVFLTH